VSQIDELLHNSRTYTERFAAGDLPAPPARQLTIVTCMDARVNPYAIFGLRDGECHVLRNAGGVVTDDVIRSLTLSQRALGTREVLVVMHTRCGLAGLDDAEFRAQLQADVGQAPSWSTHAFDDLDAAVRESLGRLRGSPFLVHRDAVRGFVYDVETGALREVPG
jgi:carbonic anhydrase